MGVPLATSSIGLPRIAFADPSVLHGGDNVTIRKGRTFKELLDEFPVFMAVNLKGEDVHLTRVQKLTLAPFEKVEEEVLSQDLDPNNRTLGGLIDDAEGGAPTVEFIHGGLSAGDHVTVIHFIVPDLQCAPHLIAD